MDRRSLFKASIAAAAMAPMLSASGALAQAAADTKYTFYHLLWGMTDANVQFHIKAGEAFMQANPNVEIKYVGPEAYDPAEHAKFLDTIINSSPNGIALHISSVDALLPGLTRAKEAGIPVVSVTSHPPAEADNEKLKGFYLTWVGADEKLIGVRMGEALLERFTPKHVIYALPHLGHAGHEQRAQGFFDSMPADVKKDRLAVGEEPVRAKDVLQSFLAANPDIDVIFGAAPLNKQMTDVVAQSGRDIKVLTSDDAPSSLEGILADEIFLSFSQQFPVQGPFAYETLFLYNQAKMAPVAPIVTGPLVIDKANAQQFKDLALGVFGQDGYDSLNPY